MLKLLVISPHFAPTNAPDMQRIRLLLPHLESAGVEATVLAVSPDCVDFPEEDWLCSAIPPRQEIHRVSALGEPWRKLPGLGSLATRAYRSLQKKGNELLRTRSFDIVYFSTTQFGIHLLGPYWKSKFGVPFVMDFQDPWVNNYYRENPDITPPGGRLKFAMADRFNRIAEPKVIGECAGITCVSAAYPEMLRDRYPETKFLEWSEGSPSCEVSCPTLTIPFPFDIEDSGKDRPSSAQSVFDPNDGCTHWFHAGRCTGSMEKSLRALFDAFAKIQTSEPERFDSVRIHFVGTQYHADLSSDSLIMKLAREYRLRETVSEHPERIPYSEVLRCLDDADLLLGPGSDDPGYSASKIFPYLLSETPALLVFHEKSPIIQLSREAGGSVAVPFRNDEATGDISHRILQRFDGSAESIRVPVNSTALEPYSAVFQARLLAHFFDQCCRLHQNHRNEVALTS
ncbi:MAG: hypothetical protein AAGF67_01420 [Verrucomicrobiota bacterium]